MAGKKTILRTAHAGDVFRLDENTVVTHEGTEFPSEAAAANAIADAAHAGIQLYVTEPADPDDDEDPIVENALLASGLVSEQSEPEPKAKETKQVASGQQGGGN